MLQTVQLVLANAGYAAALRDALHRSGPWHVVCCRTPDPKVAGVVVVDEDALDQMPTPVQNPERVVLITRKDPQHLSRAWEAGLFSVVSEDDPPDTVLLAIMAAALRGPKGCVVLAPGGISPNPPQAPGAISPTSSESGTKSK